MCIDSEAANIIAFPRRLKLFQAALHARFQVGPSRGKAAPASLERPCVDKAAIH